MITDYSQGKIYKIVCNKTGLQYIGSTKEKYLSRRLARHKQNYNDFQKGKGHYMSSFKLFDNKDVSIILIETYPCNSKYELESRERYWIENSECVNMVVPTRTRKEKRESNTELTKELDKERYNKRKDYFQKKYICQVCQIEICLHNKKRHESRQIHISKL